MTIAERLQTIVEALPPGTAVTIPADALRAWLAEDPAQRSKPEPVLTPQSWRTLLWSVPEATRLGVNEIAEALDRSPDWVYRATSPEQAA